MMNLLNDVVFRCNKCGSINVISKNEIEFYVSGYDHGDNCMGEEIDYEFDKYVECQNCSNNIHIRIFGDEYPIGAYDYDEYNIDGAEFINSPTMGIIYDQVDFELDYAIPIYNRIESLIINLSNNNQEIYNITPREFEEVIEQLLKDEGFETELTKATRDGGRDIIATKYELGKPIVFYFECKRYGANRNVSVDIVRALYGVQTSDRINKSILVTTGHVTNETRKFVEHKTKTLMDIIDLDDIKKMLDRSAMKYYSEF